MKFFKFFQYAYLLIAAIFLVEAYLAWGETSQRAYIFIGLALLAIFMFFFKRHFRNKYNQKP